MPLNLAVMIQAGLPAMDFSSMPAVAEETQWEEQVGNSLVVREPVGVIGCITPWNYPLHQVCAKVAPALTAGCAVIVKPSEVKPLSSFVLAEIVDELGLPRASSTSSPATGREWGSRWRRTRTST